MLYYNISISEFYDISYILRPRAALSDIFAHLRHFFIKRRISYPDYLRYGYQRSFYTLC